VKPLEPVSLAACLKADIEAALILHVDKLLRIAANDSASLPVSTLAFTPVRTHKEKQ
jgi:hypothetical protein